MLSWYGCEWDEKWDIMATRVRGNETRFKG